MAETSADRIKNLRALNAEYERQLTNLEAKASAEKQSALLSQQHANNEKLINELIIQQGEHSTENVAEIQRLVDKNDKIKKQQEEINKQLEAGIKARQRHVDLAKLLVTQLQAGWKYLQESDKIIKSTNLNLGLSGAKAAAMRDSFEKSAGYVARLGGTMGDIQAVMQGFADETGRARAMTEETVKDITAIGKGTGLGVEQAALLGAQFEYMGLDARATMDYVQGVVDTSERMGVNTTKVLKNVNDNFKKLNTYTFRQGVKGFAEMAMYAEKFKIDISQALNAADVARSLEGAIDLSAQLQIMGGEFAKTDPFELLYLSRNDPAKMMEKIADMTKGIVSFRKMADGSFEKFISPADRDRIAAVAKSMGMEAEALTVAAERQAEIQRMRQQMAGVGLSDEQKKLIEGAAEFDSATGKFQVKLGGTIKNISELTGKQAESFVKEQVMLEERAKTAMTFDETFKATIEILKTALLPLLKQINWVLDHTLKPLADLATKGWGGMAIAAGSLLTAGLLWKGISNKLANIAANYVSQGGGKGVSGFLGRTAGGGGGAVGGIKPGDVGSDFTKTGQIRKGAAGLTKAKGTASLAKGAGVGAAGAGVGAGIMLAAKGIGDLAQSIKDVDVEKLKQMNKTIGILGGTMVAILVPAIFAMGSAGTAGAVGLLAVGAAAVGIGFAINLATKGIGKMAEGFATMFDSISKVDNMTEVTAGLAGMMAVLATATITLPAAIGLGFAVGKIGKHAEDLVKVGTAMENIKLALSGSRDDFVAVQNAVESISNMNTKGGGMLADLARLLKKPLKVEFAKGNVMLHNDITLDIDKTTFMRKVYDPQIAVQMQHDLKIGKG